VPNVIVHHGAATAGLEGQAGLDAVERLYPPLFVDGQHDGMGGSTSRPNTSASLASNAGSLERMKVLMRCS
jgi:hypothetical protein